MTREQLLLVAALLVGVLLLLGWAMYAVAAREARLAQRFLGVQRVAGVDQANVPRTAREQMLRGLQGLGGLLTGSGVLSARTVTELEQTLQSAGFRGDRALAVFVGAKVLAFFGLPVLTWAAMVIGGASQTAVVFALPAACLVGMLAPDMVARHLRKRYLAEVQRSLPDALDLMVICAEAGLSLETTIERVAIEIRIASPAIATEFALCNSEMRIGSDRRRALQNMADRTRIEALRRLSATLGQSMRFGTPLVQALKTLSAELRQEQLTAFEARAAKLPVLLTVPMILFILPVLVIVAAGPALIDLLRVM
jgi:tight adherence protein C